MSLILREFVLSAFKGSVLGIAGSAVIGLSWAAAPIWIQASAPTTGWADIACTPDGTKLIAASVDGADGNIYTSTNAGATWTLTTAPYTSWTSVATSDDGQKLVAAHRYLTGSVYLSTDAGRTWTRSSIPTRSWLHVAASADGSRILAAGFSSYKCVSTDSGAAWTNSGPSGYWTSVASSRNGLRLWSTGGQGDGNRVSTSSDGGATWSELPNGSPLNSMIAIACSADGSRIIAAANNGLAEQGVFISMDSGATWKSNALPGLSWQSTASSSNFTTLVVAAGRYFEDGSIYTSTDAGTNWTENIAPYIPWQSVTSSGDGTRLFAASATGGIYTCQLTRLHIESLGPNVLVSWPTNGIGLSLQQNRDLTTTNWTRIEMTPTETNGRNQLILLSPTGANFFRLMSP